jgi:hypothetical protein
MPRCRHPASKPAGYVRGVITVSGSDANGPQGSIKKAGPGVAAAEGDHPKRRPKAIRRYHRHTQRTLVIANSSAGRSDKTGWPHHRGRVGTTLWSAS